MLRARSGSSGWAACKVTRVSSTVRRSSTGRSKDNIKFNETEPFQFMVCQLAFSVCPSY